MEIVWGRDSRKHCINHGQNVVDKLTKLSKITSSVGYFTADILQFSSTTVKTCLLDDRLGTGHKFQAFQEFS